MIDFEHLWSSRSDEHVKSDCVGTVFQTAFLTACYNPETLSRVTLASLGIVFQTNLAAIISECINKTNRIKHQ